MESLVISLFLTWLTFLLSVNVSLSLRLKTGSCKYFSMFSAMLFSHLSLPPLIAVELAYSAHITELDFMC